MKLTRNFELEEFKCRDGSLPNTAQLLANVKRLAEQLQILRNHLGRPIKVVSGYRSPAHNTKVRGAKFSRHVTAEAADIRVEGVTAANLHKTIEALIASGQMKDGGLGFYPVDLGKKRYVGWVHYDVRSKRARWSG